MDKIELGDVVTVRGCFNMDEPQSVTVEAMEVTEHARERYGDPRAVVPVELVQANRVVFSLTNGHWCYSEQVQLPGGRWTAVGWVADGQTFREVFDRMAEREEDGPPYAMPPTLVHGDKIIVDGTLWTVRVENLRVLGNHVYLCSEG